MVALTDLDVSRWDRAWPPLPYLFILLPAAFALLRDWRPEVLALALLAGAWHWFMVTSHPGWTERPAVKIIYFVVMLAVIGALVRTDTLFTVTGLGAFFQSFTLLPGRWAYAGVAATAGVLVAARPGLGRPLSEMLYSFLVAVLIASTVGLLIRTVSDQNDNRKVMIAQLKETGAKLAALAEDNAILQAQLLTRAREAGALGERQRMAREIHDTIAQGLTAVLTQLEAADSMVEDVPAVRSRLNTVRTLARDSLNEARRSVQALRPAPLDDAQLAAALHDIATKWSQTTGTPASVSVTGDPRPLHVEVEITLLRVAQEALTNVGKHASATRVGLTLSYMEDVVALDVRDDGSGFTPEATGSSNAGGFGLIAMRQRVTRLAGAFAIETAPGQGTGISATVPAIPATSDSGSSNHSRNAL
ncbi:signal transduction histidine kinase [Streptosporangium album]|uniref:Oxygen sensor histidine kinase NreB n=1 Tax=Streptosporangium album TaxID=47479 RepID=A0A7W7RW23_9ACTN|nr:sensor histidine kinase [Streptosporangium album]MBB4939235.1 signal transduction histidine kinase [Streptosporangium album]